MEVTYSLYEREDGGLVAELSAPACRALQRVMVDVDPDDRSPVLRWQIDIVWKEANPPRTQAEAARWYEPHRPTLQAALAQLADTLAVGLDIDSWAAVIPFDIPDGPTFARLFALRRVQAGPDRRGTA